MLLLQPEFMDFQGGVGILGTRKMQPGDVLEPPGHRGGCPCGHTGTEKSWCALHVSCWAQVSHATYLRARALTAQTGMEFGYPSISPYTKLLTFVQVNCKTQCMCCSSIIGASYGLYIWGDLSSPTRKLNIWDSLYVLRRAWIIYRVKRWHSGSNHKAVFKMWSSSMLERSVYPHGPFLSIKISAQMLLLLWGLGSPSTRSRHCFPFCWMYIQGDIMAFSGLWQ